MRTIKLSYNILSQALIRSKNTIPSTNKHKILFIILEMGGGGGGKCCYIIAVFCKYYAQNEGQ